MNPSCRLSSFPCNKVAPASKPGTCLILPPTLALVCLSTILLHWAGLPSVVNRYALFVSLSTKILPRLGLIFAAPTTVFRLLLRRSWLSKWLLGLHLDRPPGRLPATKFPPLDKLSIFFVFSRLFVSVYQTLKIKKDNDKEMQHQNPKKTAATTMEELNGFVN